MKLDILRAVNLYGSTEAVHIAAEIGMPIGGGSDGPAARVAGGPCDAFRRAGA